jgi:hypothetical protein
LRRGDTGFRSRPSNTDASLLSEPGKERNCADMPQNWKRLLIGGAGFGVGFALTLLAVSYLHGWYSSRPKPWNPNALKAKYLETGTEDGQNQIVFFYVIRNTTRYDYRIPSTIIRMSRDEHGIEMADNFVTLDEGVMVPAGSEVKVRVLYPGPGNSEYFSSTRSQTAESRSRSGVASVDDIETPTKQEERDNRRREFDEETSYLRNPASWVHKNMPELRGLSSLTIRLGTESSFRTDGHSNSSKSRRLPL